MVYLDLCNTVYTLVVVVVMEMVMVTKVYTVIYKSRYINTGVRGWRVQILYVI